MKRLLNLRCVPAVVFSAAVLVPLSTARPQDAKIASRPDKTEVRPLERFEAEANGPADSRKELIKAIGDLVAQEDAKRHLLKELRGAFDGAAPTALKVHLVELMVLEDQSRMLPLVSRARERLRWDIARDLKHKEKLAADRSEAVLKVGDEIARLADEIVSRERAADADDVIGLQRELLQRKLQRNEADAKAAEYAAHVKVRQQELADLDRLKKWVAANRREAAIRNERLRDAVEHEQTTLLADQVDAGRQSLKDTLAMLQARRSDSELAIVSSSENPVRDGVPVTQAVAAAVRSSPLSDDERALIEEELQKARERRTSPAARD